MAAAAATAAVRRQRPMLLRPSLTPLPTTTTTIATAARSRSLQRSSRPPPPPPPSTRACPVSASAAALSGPPPRDVLRLERDVLAQTRWVRFPGLAGLGLRLITPDCPLYHARPRDSAFDNLPWWGFLWPGGFGACAHLLAAAADGDSPGPTAIAATTTTVHGRTVLDFACGCGAAAILALALGARRVIANDVCSVAVATTRLNAALNARQEGGKEDEELGSLLKLPTDWERRLQLVDWDLVGTLPSSGTHGDDHRNVMDGVNIVLAGDVLYDDALARAVFPWFQDLADRGVEVLVGDPGRWVLREMAERGETDALLEEVAQYPLDPQIRAEHNGLHTARVWRVKGRVHDP